MVAVEEADDEVEEVVEVADESDLTTVPMVISHQVTMIIPVWVTVIPEQDEQVVAIEAVAAIIQEADEIQADIMLLPYLTRTLSVSILMVTSLHIRTPLSTWVAIENLSPHS